MVRKAVHQEDEAMPQTTTMKRRRAPQCSRDGCKAHAKKAGKCLAHYIEDYRAGVRHREPAGLGDNPGRIEFEVSRELLERLHEQVPAGERGHALRRALEAELLRLSEGQG
jgi:hypothetical protein